jgi:hypothetical protein
LEIDMDKAAMIKLAITGAALFAAYRFAPSAEFKTAVLGVAGVVVLKNTPIVNQYIAV